MATNKNITMKQFNRSDYDTLYPTTVASQIVDGTLPITRGGTGRTHWNDNRLVYASGSTLDQIAFPTSSGSILRQDTTGAPYWSGIDELSSSLDSFKVGDVLVTVRDDLGDKFVPAQRQRLKRSEYQELSEVYPFKQYSPFKIAGGSSSYRSFTKVYGKNKFIRHTSIASNKIEVIDADANTSEEYILPIGSASGYLIGIDHNGASWVVALANPNITILEIADDFSEILCSHSQTFVPLGVDYCQTGFMFDGTQYYLLAERQEYYSSYLISFDSNLQFIWSALLQYNSSVQGYPYLFRIGERIAMYASNSQSSGRLYLLTHDWDGTRSAVFYDWTFTFPDKPAHAYGYRYSIKMTNSQYIVGTISNAAQPCVIIYNSFTNTLSTLSLGLDSNICCGPIFFDSEIQACVIAASLYSTYYKITIDYGKDPTILSNYSILADTKIVLDGSMSSLCACDDNMNVWDVNGQQVLGAIKMPVISISGANTYIKAAT